VLIFEGVKMSMILDTFQRDGFCIIRNAISKELISAANNAIDKFRDINDKNLIEHDLLVEGLLQRVVNLHYSVKPLQKIFIEAMEIGSEVVDQYGEATLYTSLFFELGSQQPLHRDTPYFYSGGNGGYMGVWVALDDVDERNGALVAVRGSHLLPEPDLEKLKEQFHPNSKVPPSSTPLFNAYNEKLIEMAKVANLEVVTCTVQKGDMIIWNPSTLHGGLEHIDKKMTRRSFVMHITPKNMPMHHMDYFFDRSKKINSISREYYKYSGRLFGAGNVVDFRHIKQIPVSQLGTYEG
jgi:phytanoyl-CoA hydroxylase